MALPACVVLDRTAYGLNAFDLSPLVRAGSLSWSSVVPGGFASCSFSLDGDFRQLVKQIPYLSIVRVIGDSGRVLFEGQVEDRNPSLSDTAVGMKVGAFGLQNVLKETTVRAIWSKRDLSLTDEVTPVTSAAAASLALSLGQFDNTNLTRVGVLIQGNSGASLANGFGRQGQYVIPTGLTILRVLADATRGSGAGTLTLFGTGRDNTGTATPFDFSTTSTITQVAETWTPKANSVKLLFGAQNSTGGAFTPTTGDFAEWENIRLLGVITSEDTAGGFNGDTLIRSLLSSYVTELGQGIIESGSDFTIDHLDASVRRTAYDILSEIASYYAREWAVWENALLDWRTPNLSQPQWIIPINQLAGLDLDASVQNSQKTSLILYTDAASGLTAEASAASSDRRNPYVLTGRAKDQLVSAPFPMTSTTATQLASALLNDLGFGPVPAAGTISVPGETIIQHAQGNALKAWEIRAGDNITIPELPLVDVFTQDGRGEVLFHVVSAEANADSGTVTFTLDSYGSKRSDVLMARLAAVTQALGG